MFEESPLIDSKYNLTYTSRENLQQLSSLSELTLKLQEQSSLNCFLESEIGKYRALFSDCLTQFHAREASLCSLLEAKECNIKESNSKILDLIFERKKINENKNRAAEELALHKTLRDNEETKSHRCDINLKAANKIQSLFKDIFNIGKTWRCANECDVDDNTECLSELNSLIESLTAEKALQEVKIECLIKENQRISEEIKACESLNAEIELMNSQLYTMNGTKSKINETLESLNEKSLNVLKILESLKSEKETLASRLEAAHEDLVSERIVSEQYVDYCTKAKEDHILLNAKITEEKMVNERLQEQLLLEKKNMSEVTEEIQRLKDLDSILQSELKEINMEGAIVKNFEGYIHGNNIVNIALHSESFIVVKEKNSSIPLVDYLHTCKKKEVKSEKKIELKENEYYDRSKSPARISNITPISQMIKPQKRERYISLTDKKRILHK